MDRIKLLEEFISLTKQAQERGLKNINCYLLPNEVESLIRKNALYYIANDHTLQFVEKHDRYNKVCFFADENFLYIPFEDVNSIIADLPYNRVMPERFVNFKNQLEKYGFVVNSSTSRMSKRNFEDETYGLTGFSIEELKSDEIDEVFDIWEENFDQVENLLYSKREMVENTNPVFTLKNDQGQILGAMELVINGSQGWVQRISIRKSAQGRGLGSVLERFYINKCKSLGIKTLLLYTVDSNLNAQKFHKKFGFEEDGKRNCQMIYIKEKKNG